MTPTLANSKPLAPAALPLDGTPIGFGPRFMGAFVPAFRVRPLEPSLFGGWRIDFLLDGCGRNSADAAWVDVSGDDLLPTPSAVGQRLFALCGGPRQVNRTSGGIFLHSEERGREVTWSLFADGHVERWHGY